MVSKQASKSDIPRRGRGEGGGGPPRAVFLLAVAICDHRNGGESEVR